MQTLEQFVGANLGTAPRAHGPLLADDTLAVRQPVRPGVDEAADQETVDGSHNDDRSRHAHNRSLCPITNADISCSATTLEVSTASGRESLMPDDSRKTLTPEAGESA